MWDHCHTILFNNQQKHREEGGRNPILPMRR